MKSAEQIRERLSAVKAASEAMGHMAMQHEASSEPGYVFPQRVIIQDKAARKTIAHVTFRPEDGAMVFESVRGAKVPVALFKAIQAQADWRLARSA